MEDRTRSVYQKISAEHSGLLFREQFEDAELFFLEHVIEKAQAGTFKSDFMQIDSYAARVALNFLIDHHRELKRLREVAFYAIDEKTGEEITFNLIDNRDSPEIEALKREGWAGLCGVDPHLTDIDIQVLKLKSEGYSHEETAETLNKSLDSVKHIFSRALKRLRDACKRKGLKEGDIMEILYPFCPPPRKDLIEGGKSIHKPLEKKYFDFEKIVVTNRSSRFVSTMWAIGI